MGKATAVKKEKTVTVTQKVQPDPAVSVPVAVAAAAAENAGLRIDGNGVSLVILAEVVGATRSDVGHGYMLTVNVQRMIDLGLVEQAPVELVPANAEGALATRATQAGFDYFEAASKAEQEAAKPAAPAWGNPAPRAPQVLPDLSKPNTPAPAANAAPAKAAAPRRDPVKTDPASISSVVAGVPIPERKRGGEGFKPREAVYPFGATPIGASFFVAGTEAKPDPGKSIAASCKAAAKKHGGKFIVRTIEDGTPWGFAGKKGCAVYHVAEDFDG